MEPLTSVKQQVREQTEGAGGAFVRRLLLWVLIFSGATLTWWQVWRLGMIADDLIGGQGVLGQSGEFTALALATLGVVIAVGLAAITVMAAEWCTALICTVLLFAPMVLFGQWRPLTIWWFLGPVAVLIFIRLLAIRGDIGGKVRWSPLRIVLGTTLWTMILVALVAPPALTLNLMGREDRMRPEQFRHLAEIIIERAPAEVAFALIDELPNTPAEIAPPPTTAPAEPTPAPPVTPAPASPEGKPTAKGNAVAPTGIEGQIESARAMGTLMAEGEPAAETSGKPTFDDHLALGLWHAFSIQGEGYLGLPPLLPHLLGLALALVVCPLIIAGLVASAIIMGIVLWLLRATEFVLCVPVRVESPRFTLRSPRYIDEGTEL